MSSYDVFLHPKYFRKYEKLQKRNPKIHAQIKKGLDELKKDPFNKENKLLKDNWKGYRRIKVGNYRIIYKIVFNEDEEVYEVNVLKFGNRKNVYKNS